MQSLPITYGNLIYTVRVTHSLTSLKMTGLYMAETCSSLYNEYKTAYNHLVVYLCALEF